MPTPTTAPGTPTPVIITYYQDKSFSLELKTPPASFLVKHLLLPWQEGARWFFDTLVDADLASNTLGWQWTAGCGADAAPYFRVFNPALQAAKFDPDGVYQKRWATATPCAPIVDHAIARDEALAAYAHLRR